MGYELRSLESNAHFLSNYGFWPHVLDIAQHYGWNPEGTIDGMRTQEIGWEKAQAENARNVDGYYSGGFIEIVTKSDANKLADALQRVLTDFAKNDKKINKSCSCNSIKEVIELCRHGAFEII